MKSRLNRFTFIPLTLALAISVMISFSLPAVQRASQSAIGKAFPVSYSVDYGGENTVAQTVPVRFEGDTAVILSGSTQRTIPVSSAVFTCIDRQELTRNALRTGLLFMLLSALLYCLPFALIFLSVSPCKNHNSHNAKKRIRTSCTACSPIPEAA